MVVSAAVWLMLLPTLMAEEVCPFDTQEEIAKLRAIAPEKHQKYAGWAMFPRHVFYTGPRDPGIHNLTWRQGMWPAAYKFHYYDDARMSKSVEKLDQVISKAGVDGLLEAYSALRAWAFKADLWRYAILFACGGIYVDSKMRIAMNFDSFIEQGRFEPSRDKDLKEQRFIVTCNDRWGTSLDRFKNLTAFWQGFLIATPRNPDFLIVLKSVIANVQRRSYPEDEGNLRMLYITGPCAMGRALQTDRPDWHKTVKIPCHWGNHGAELRTIWGSGGTLFLMDNNLHKSLQHHTGTDHAYPNLYKAHQIYIDDPPCTENCNLIGKKIGQKADDRRRRL